MNPQWASSSFELTRPGMLVALVLLAPVAWYFFYSLSDFPRWQRMVSLALRFLILLLLVLALAGLSRFSPTDEKYVVVAVDRSLSVGDEAATKIEEEAENIRASELVRQFKMEMGLEDPIKDLPDDLDLDLVTKEKA